VKIGKPLENPAYSRRISCFVTPGGLFIPPFRSVFMGREVLAKVSGLAWVGLAGGVAMKEYRRDI
jgi:hypothetical protein